MQLMCLRTYTEMNVLFVSLFVFLFIYLFTYLLIYLFIYLTQAAYFYV